MTVLGDERRQGRVFLVGAGPGDPELLTLRALRILMSADVVLHDDLVSQEILALIRTGRVENVGKRCGAKRISQEWIHARMIDLAREGFMVVRLKSGDPLFFGRAGEEIDALRDAGVEFEIIPGVTAASSAAACAKIALTDRRHASQVIFASAHHSAERAAVADTGCDDPRATTLVIHMPGNDFAGLQQRLLDSGRNPGTACLIVSNASRIEEQVFATNLKSLARAPRLLSPKILIVGGVAASAVHQAGRPARRRAHEAITLADQSKFARTRLGSDTGTRTRI